MFISIDALSFPPNRRDVYTAVEIAQMIPLFSQGKTYERFLEKNSWIKNHLANFSPEEPILLVEEDKKYYVNKGVLQFAKLLQLPFIFMHKTTEIVTETLFAFHPRDYRTYVLEEYNKRLKSYSL